MRISTKDSIGKRAKQILRRDLDDSLAEISDLPSGDAELDEIVHDIRKRFKKMRALLRLLRPRLGKRIYQRENQELRDASRPLRELRDAEALLESLEKLKSIDSDPDLQIPVAELRCDLLDRKEILNAQLRQTGLICDELTTRLQGVRDRMKAWKLKRLRWTELRDRLKHAWTLCIQTLHDAVARPAPEHVHEWRKQVKYLCNQLEILKPVWDQIENSLGKDLNQLADLLGDAHDLAVLNQAVAGYFAPRDFTRTRSTAESEHLADGNDHPADAPTEFEELLFSIDTARQDLQQSAFVLGHKIFTQSRRRVIRDIDQWWKGAS